MSNPGVIPLFVRRKEFGGIDYLQIEDNIGESIHIHLNDYRLSLTLDEFENLVRIFREALLSLDSDIGCLIQNPGFLYQAYSFYDYNELIIETKTVNLNDLKFIQRSIFLRFFCNIQFVNIANTQHYKYLEKNEREFLKYSQYNYYGIDNNARIKGVRDYISSGGYSTAQYSLVTFGDNFLIRDGMHTASSIAHLYGKDADVRVVQIVNKNIKHYFNFAWLLMFKANISIFLFLLKRFLKFIMLTYKYK
jgi:hypothetical protein